MTIAPRLLLARRATAAVLIFGAAAGCPKTGPRVQVPGLAAAWPIDAAGLGPVAGLAVAGDAVIVAAERTVARFDAGARTWTRELAAAAGPTALHGDTIVVAVSGRGALAGLPHGLRGDPGAALLGLDATTGAPRWTVSVGATEWVIVRAIAPGPDGFLIAGVFAGTLRIGDHVVTSAGSTDGFWARVGADGAVASAQRFGGASADAIAGIAALPDGGLALAGTYTQGATLVDQELAGLHRGPPSADGFVARLGTDDRVAWVRTWGGAEGDSCAGVVATADGVAIAGTVRGVVDVAGRRLDVRGLADGLVAYFDRGGAVRAAFLVGGDDLDGLTAIAGRGDTVVATGWYAGSLDAPAGRLSADGGDDPMIAIATVDGPAAIASVRADGVAAVHALAADATTWAIAIGSATAAALGDDPLAAGTTVRAMRW